MSKRQEKISKEQVEMWRSNGLVVNLETREVGISPKPPSEGKILTSEQLGPVIYESATIFPPALAGQGEKEEGGIEEGRIYEYDIKRWAELLIAGCVVRERLMEQGAISSKQHPHINFDRIIFFDLKGKEYSFLEIWPLRSNSYLEERDEPDRVKFSTKALEENDPLRQISVTPQDIEKITGIRLKDKTQTS